MKLETFQVQFRLRHLVQHHWALITSKWGFTESKHQKKQFFCCKTSDRAAKECNPKIKIAVAGYADAEKIGAINPLLIPEIAHKAQVDVAMLDTSVKDGKNLFDHLTIEQLKKFVDLAHSFGLEAALAGSLEKTGFTHCLRFRR